MFHGVEGCGRRSVAQLASVFAQRWVCPAVCVYDRVSRGGEGVRLFHANRGVVNHARLRSSRQELRRWLRSSRAHISFYVYAAVEVYQTQMPQPDANIFQHALHECVALGGAAM